MDKEKIIDILEDWLKAALDSQPQKTTTPVRMSASLVLDEILPHMKIPRDTIFNCGCGASYPLASILDSLKTYGGHDIDRRKGERREPFKYFRGTVTDDYFPDEPKRVYNRPGKDIGWIYDQRKKDRRKK